MARDGTKGGSAAAPAGGQRQQPQAAASSSSAGPDAPATRSKQQQQQQQQGSVSKKSNPPPPAPAEEGAAFDNQEPSLDDLIDGYGYGYFHFMLYCFLAIAGLSAAKEMVTLSFLGPALSCQFGTDGYEWLLQAAVFGGALLSAPFYGYMADRWGRKPAIVTACFLVAIPSLLTALANSFWVVLGLRFLVGLGIPFDPIMFTYYLEFLPDQHRGRQIVALTISWMAALVLESGLAWATLGKYGWQVYAAASSAPAVLAALLSPLLMESPYFLLDQGKLRRTVAVLRRIAQMSGKPPPREMGDGEEELQDVAVGRDGAAGAAAAAAAAAEGEGEDAEEDDGCCTSSLVLPFCNIFPVLWDLCRPSRLWKTLCMVVFTASLAFATIGLVELSVLIHFPPGEPSSQCGPGGGSGFPLLSSKEWEQVLISNLSGVWGVLLACTVIDFLGRRSSLLAMMFFAATFTSLMLLPVTESVKNVFLTVARTAVHGGYPILAVMVGELYSSALRGKGESLAEVATSLSYMFGPLVTDRIVYFRGGASSAIVVIAAVLWLGVAALLVIPGRPPAAAQSADNKEGVSGGSPSKAAS